jgi:hypothetical protein
MSWPAIAALRPAHCSMVAGALRAHLCPVGPDGACCAPTAPSSRCLSAVEVDPSRVDTGLLFLVPTRSSTSILQAAYKHHEAADDVDYKIVVAHVGGRRRWVVALQRARVFL